jgi:hypothetical protein
MSELTAIDIVGIITAIGTILSPIIIQIITSFKEYYEQKHTTD